MYTPTRGTMATADTSDTSGFAFFLTRPHTAALELDHLSLALLVAAQLEVLATLQRGLFAVLALGALHAQHNLLGGLGLLPEDGLGLATESLLLAIVTPTTLGGAALLRLLVLRDLVQLVALALLAEGLTLLGNVHLERDDREKVSTLFVFQ